jgi:hypothetical protein
MVLVRADPNSAVMDIRRGDLLSAAIALLKSGCGPN